jgi:arylformamidase
MVFLHYDQAELDRQYDQRAWAPNAAAIIQGYHDNSERVRARLGEPEVFAYGESPAETLDVYAAKSSGAPLHVFIHGGAWRLLGKRDSAFAAEAFVNAGAHFVALDFALAPQAALGTMVAQVRSAVAWLYRHAHRFGGDRERIFVSGHSSGAHLAACAAVTRWAERYGLPAGVMKGALCASGSYELEPVRLSARNEYLRLDPEAVEAFSPLRHLADLGCPLIVAVGEHETDEFRRQAREFAAAAGVPLVEGKGLNHFEISETLADPRGLLGRLALRQMSLPVS